MTTTSEPGNDVPTLPKILAMLDYHFTRILATIDQALDDDPAGVPAAVSLGEAKAGRLCQEVTEDYEERHDAQDREEGQPGVTRARAHTPSFPRRPGMGQPQWGEAFAALVILICANDARGLSEATRCARLITCRLVIRRYTGRHNRRSARRNQLPFNRWINGDGS